MLQDFQGIGQFNLAVSSVVINILVALACSLVIALVYRMTYSGPGYSIMFVNSLVILAMITAVVIMVIGNNLARAFGLVGAMSIIRFRTAVKETHDIIFIFFALAIGMAAGVGYHAIAVTGTLLVGAIVLVLTKSSSASPNRQEFLLQMAYSPNGNSEEASHQAVLNRYCRRDKLINAKSIGEDDAMELSYYVELKNVNNGKEFIRELKRVEGVRHVNLFFDDEHFYA